MRVGVPRAAPRLTGLGCLLALTCEMRGYLYVLSYTGDGTRVADYKLDLYTLNYEWFPGPGGRTEPSISTWLPTTPQGEVGEE